MWAWGILAVVLVLGVLYARQLWRTIAALSSYVVCLLLSDEYREQERRRLEGWMQETDCSNDAAVMVQASAFVLEAAQDVARHGPRAIPQPAVRASRKRAA